MQVSNHVLPAFRSAPSVSAPSAPGGSGQPGAPEDRVQLREHGLGRALTGAFYGGVVLPLAGSALASTAGTPLQLATALVGGTALGGLAGGFAAAMWNEGDALSGWLRGAGTVAAPLAMGSLGGPWSVVPAVPLMGAAGYLTQGHGGPRDVRHPAARALGWLGLLATNVAAPVLVHLSTGDVASTTVTALLAGVSTLMMINPDG